MTVTSSPAATRWQFIDALRGFVLCGILLVNAVDITGVGDAWIAAHATALPDDPTRTVLDAAVQTRFVPIFNTLFGMSLWFVLAGARTRSARPGLVLVRRLAALVGIGAVTALVYPGNILYEYGVVGLLVLPAVLWLPRWAVLGAGVVLTVAAYAATGGGLAATPGLMLLGAGAAAAGLPARLESAGRGVRAVFLASAVATVPLLVLQLTTTTGDPRFSTLGGVAGSVMAVLYATALSLLWHTRARPVVAAVFEPLGRMALSNYVGAAVVLALLAVVVPFGGMVSALPVVLLSVALLVVQWIGSRLWLRHFAYGPVEWLWRTVTWWRPARSRRPVPAPAG